jgi:hypothetical protein
MPTSPVDRPILGTLCGGDATRPRVEQASLGGAAGTLASLGDWGITVMEGVAAETALARPRPDEAGQGQA